LEETIIMKRIRGNMVARGSWLAATMLLVLAAAGILWAVSPALYNRPNPLMDYVPQEIGVYDTVYSGLDESECRSCHGNNLADRHHMSQRSLCPECYGPPYETCTYCHPVPTDLNGDGIWEPAPIDYYPKGTYDEYENGVRMADDCTAEWCHEVAFLDPPPDGHGWHHNTDMADSKNCIACHDPNLIEEIAPIQDFQSNPPTILSLPTPFSCENCHWAQRVVAAAPGFDPSTSPTSDAGHPSTYDHYDLSGNFVGYYEYGTPILGNLDTHHMMKFEGNVATECYLCHSTHPEDPTWDPYDPELIRACERCHTPEKLHGIGPHLGTNGWEAAGFHTSTQVPGDTDADVEPSVYREFVPDEMCLACHGDAIPEPPPSDTCTGRAPVIDNTGPEPNVGVCFAIVALRGENFGDQRTHNREVQMKKKGSDHPWMQVPVYSWTDTRIEFEIPCWSFVAGNYKVRVTTECGNSNYVIFTLKDWISLESITPEAGACGQWIKMIGNSFGNRRSKIFADGYNGLVHIVDIVSSQGTFTALRYREWSDQGFEVRFYNFFEDGLDPSTGSRNYVRDDGSGPCPEEPKMRACSDLTLGAWTLAVKAIYFQDEDSSGDLSCGDTISQVVASEDWSFDFTNSPVIYQLNPKKIERGKLLKIFGLNFGSNGEVRIGTQAAAQDSAFGLGKLQEHIKSWSNTLVKVKVRGRNSWDGKVRYVWVEKNGYKSNYKELEILEPLP
jgi:hypothetical protein